MTSWSESQLDKFGSAEEVQIASVGGDGTLGKPTTIWAVRHGDDLFIRSVRGRHARWFRGTQESHEGRIQRALVQRERRFGNLLESSCQPVGVLRSHGVQGPQHDQIKRALQELDTCL